MLRIGIIFGGRAITQPGRLNIDIPRELAVIGRVKAIDYDAVYDGALTPARHAFAPGARPLLMVGVDRGQVFLVGKNYRFTDRGFIDYDSRDRKIEYNEKTGKISPLRD